MIRLLSIGAVLSCVAILCGVAAAAPAAPKRKVAVDLIADRAAVKAGETVTLAIRQKIEPGWHTYWTNPGDSGEPTTVEWRVEGAGEPGPLKYPLPHAIPIAGLTNYGFENEVLLLTEVAVPNTAQGHVVVSGKVSYLVCKDICIPEEADVSLTLPVAAEAQPSRSEIAIRTAKDALPKPLMGTATFAEGDAPKRVMLAVKPNDAALIEKAEKARFYPAAWGLVANSDPQPARTENGTLTLQLPRGEGGSQSTLEGLLALTGKDGTRTGYTLTAQNDPRLATASIVSAPAQGAAAGGAGATSGAEGTSGITLATAILFAFLGGVILNLMPCVFPVLALKALSFAKAPVRKGYVEGLTYLAGVLASFTVFAAAILALREGGSAFGWGFQFQSPAFVLGLAVLFFAMGLSLSGVLEFGSGLMSAGDRLARMPGSAGTFFTGVLAAVAATPCTAPFMGAAIGFGISQPAPVLFAILIALGLGFAAPVFALSTSPLLQRILPKPGAWMETLKQFLAFPLYATAAWLVWVLSIQTGSNGVMGAAVALIGVSFAAWLAAKTAFASAPIRILAPVAAGAAILFGIMLGSVDDGQPASAEQGRPSAGLKTEAYSPARLAGLRAEGRPVFVNLTAAWCITCKVNERVALDSASLASEFDRAGVVYLKGDWTRKNPEISALLSQFGRAGVPLYLFYPAGGGEPRILPQILTESLVLNEIKTKSATAPQPKGA
jgi:thiol:disulfide interchange protein DsbD